MYQYLVMGDDVRLVHGTVGNARADHDQKVGFVHRAVGIGLSVIADHAEIHGMLRGHDADSHHGGDHGDAELFREASQFLAGAAQGYAAARIDQRTLRLFQLLNDLSDLDGMSLYRGFIGPHAYLLRIAEAVKLRILDVDRDVDEDRSFPSRTRHIEGFLENPGNIVYIPHQIAVFYKGLRRSGDIRFLEHIASQKLAVDLAGDAYERDAVGKSRGDSGQQIGGSGTGGDGADADLSRYPRHAARSMGCILFCPDQNRPDIGIQDTVVEGTDRNAGVAEYLRHALQFQTLYDRIRSIHLCFPPFLI